MTRTTNARIAGFTFLFYIAIGISAMVLSGRATGGEEIAAQLASMAAHASATRVAAVLTLLCSFAALILAVTLYAITRDEDRDLALLGLTCRLCEGIVGGIAVQRSLGLLWLATAVSGAQVPDRDAAYTLGTYLLEGERWTAVIAGTFFAVGSTLFSWLLLRGRLIPVPLAWLGVIASVLLVVGLPLRLAAVLPDSAIQLLWGPMAAFEIPLALWLMVKGVATRTPG